MRIIDGGLVPEIRTSNPWAVTLRGAWELAVPTNRSAVRAWVRGFVGAFREPVATFFSVAHVTAFAPVSGLVTDPEPSQDPASADR